jgi:hypothetical protein
MFKTLLKDPVFRFGVALLVVVLALLVFVRTAGATEGSATLGVKTCATGAHVVEADLHVNSLWDGHNIGTLTISGKHVVVNAPSYDATFPVTPGTTFTLYVSGTFQSGETIIFPNGGMISTKAGMCAEITIPTTVIPPTVEPTTVVPTPTTTVVPVTTPTTSVPTPTTSAPVVTTTPVVTGPPASVPRVTTPTPTVEHNVPTSLPVTGAGDTLMWTAAVAIVVILCGALAVFIDRSRNN